MSNPFAATCRRFVFGLSVLALGSFVSFPALADAKHFCIPAGDGVPGLAGPPEWLSGSAVNAALDDPRWRGAAGQSYGFGSTPHSRLRAL